MNDTKVNFGEVEPRGLHHWTSMVLTAIIGVLLVLIMVVPAVLISLAALVVCMFTGRWPSWSARVLRRRDADGEEK